MVVVGVGAQTGASAVELPPEVREDTADFLRAVLDRSAKVGVRGEVTQRCLASLGFGDDATRTLLERLRWLHQGEQADRGRVHGAYDPQPFGPLAAVPGAPAGRVARLARRVLGRGQAPA